MPSSAPNVDMSHDDGHSGDAGHNDDMPWNWPSDMNFAGVKSEMTDYKLGNLSSNIIIYGAASCLFCPDIQNNTIYFMNNKDRFIYKHENEKNTLLVDMSAHNLQLWDNKLYFINIKKTDYFATGPIYSYDLNTKERKLILDKDVALFFIDNFGIYCYELEDDGTLSMYLLDLNNNVSALPYQWLLTYNEYLITCLDGYLSIINRLTDETIKIMPFENNLKVASTFHVYENKLYFAIGAWVYSLDLSTGDKKSYNAKTADRYMERIADLIILQDAVYATYGSNYIIKIDLYNNKITKYFSFKRSGNYFYSYLQTDGNRIFATLFNVDTATYKAKVIGYDEIILPPEGGNVFSAKEFGI